MGTEIKLELRSRSIVASGDIDAGSNILRLPASAGFRVGDYVIVEIGKEPGQGLRGTRGVGGTWPAKSYSNVAEMDADKSQQTNLFAWVEDSGYVYWFSPYDAVGEWRPFHGGYYGQRYYLTKVIPRSLQARVEVVSADGTLLTLDRAAHVSVRGAIVILDMSPVINQITAVPSRPAEPHINPEGVQLEFPAGDFAIGGVVELRHRNGWTLAGLGKAHTRFYSPKGVPSARFAGTFSRQTKLQDFTWQGNFGDEGYGLNWKSPGYVIPDYHGGYATETELPQARTLPLGIHLFASDGSVGQDLRVVDVFTAAFAPQNSSDSWAYRIEVIKNHPTREYMQWEFNWPDNVGGGCVDCSVWSPYLTRGFEAFKSTGIKFIRPRGTNATMSMNTAGNFLIEDAQFYFTPNNRAGSGLDEYSSIITINSNISNQNAGDIPEAAFLEQGGTIRNAQIIQDGYADAQNNTYSGISINDNNPNVRVEGGFYVAPDYKEGSNTGGAVGLGSTGTNTHVDGFQVYGKAKNVANAWNIFMIGANPTLKNHVAEVLPSWMPPAQKPSYPPPSFSSMSAPVPQPTDSIPQPTPQPTPVLSAPSPNGTRGMRIVDAGGAVWTFDGRKTLRNGVWVAGGDADEYMFYNGMVLAKAGAWWKWNGEGWEKFSDTDPVVTPEAQPDPPPPAPPVPESAPPPAAAPRITLTAAGSGYYRVMVNGVQVSQHVSEREAVEVAVNRKAAQLSNEVFYTHDYTVVVGSD